MKNYFNSCKTLAETIELYVDLSIIYKNNPTKYFLLKDDFNTYTSQYSSSIINNSISYHRTSVPTTKQYFQYATSIEQANDLFTDLFLMLKSKPAKFTELKTQYGLFKQQINSIKSTPILHEISSQLELSY